MQIILFGKPGAGKGTQAKHIADTYGAYHFSTGDIFRRHIAQENSFFGKKLRGFMENNEFTPDSIVLDVVSTELANLKAEGHFHFIFDGFPRTVEQISQLDTILDNLGLGPVKFALLFDVKNRTASNRLSSRAETSGRHEDADKRKICKRLLDYRDNTLPVVKEYERKGMLNSIQSDVIEQIVSVDVDNVIKYHTNQFVRSM